ncbi:MAG TPA: DUF4446 family protein [Actinomycetota bacterium]|jgi:hypothetical protein|nr:DUF4446 family protein [Actinomycetota bacterium]
MPISVPIAALVLSPSTLTLVALLAIGLSVVAVAYSIVNAGRTGAGVGGRVRLDDTLRGVLQGQAEHVQRLERAIRALHAAGKKQHVEIEGSVRNVGLLRYDAFEDVGGRLSFSCALLDGNGNGVVLTSINGRQETRVYAKPVSGGASAHNLSLEEEEAIRRALGGREAAVEAG